jgi:ferrous iron transport protein B
LNSAVTTSYAKSVRRIAVIGNPNCGKTTLFNALTGLRQKVGNYPGVTVEKKEGRIHNDDGAEIILVDLPGTYSLTPGSPDEQIAVDILLGGSQHLPTPNLVICVVDASNIERNLYLVTQLIDRQIPIVVALNMIDVAERGGVHIDSQALAQELGVPVVPTVATSDVGIDYLRDAIKRQPPPSRRTRSWKLPQVVEEELDELIELLRQHQNLTTVGALNEAIKLLSSNNGSLSDSNLPPQVRGHVRKDRERLDFLEIDRESVFVESRYDWIREICLRSVKKVATKPPSLSDKLEHILVHKVWGYIIFLGLMGTMFHSIFSWATVPMEWITTSFLWAGHEIATHLPPGDLRDLLIDGALSGVAAVVTFLPQILFLFLFLGLLEDTGYMARAAFIMDRLMGKVGLQGKSFVPLLSSFACAIPGIMATRTIESSRERLTTMLVAPLMSCSARLPVYTLLIGAFVPSTHVLGFVSLPGLVLFSLYLIGVIGALLVAWILKKTLLKGAPSTFIMELPPYRMPSVRSILVRLWERSTIFLREAGTFILGVSIVLWFLATYPRLENASPSDQLKQSFAGRAGHLIEPLIKPLGFDWKIGIGLIGSILQREVFVSTMGTIYNIQNADQNEGNVSLQAQLQRDRDPTTGRATFSILTAICLMVYYVFAMQCLSTVAVMRRETNGWKWPMFQVGYMTVLAYGATFSVYHIGLFVGLGG